MKNKILSITFILLIVISNTCFAANIKSSGTAIIENNNLRKAQHQAQENALLNALKSYFETNEDPAEMPEVTIEFFKFIKSYKVLERYVSDFTVYYTIEADIDEVAKNDLTHYLNRITHSVIYFINNNDIEKVPEVSKSLVNKVTKNILSEYSFSSKYQDAFELKLSESPDFEEIIRHFGISKARHLFYIEINANCQNKEDMNNCNVSTVSRIFLKDRNFPAIKAPSSASASSIKEAFMTAYDKNLNNTLQYVRANLISLPELQTEVTDIKIEVINYKTFSSIQKIFNTLKRKRMINEFNIQSYTANKIIFNIESTFTQTKLISKLKTLIDKFEFSVMHKNNSILMDFAPPKPIE